MSLEFLNLKNTTGLKCIATHQLYIGNYVKGYHCCLVWGSEKDYNSIRLIITKSRPTVQSQYCHEHVFKVPPNLLSEF